MDGSAAKAFVRSVVGFVSSEVIEGHNRTTDTSISDRSVTSRILISGTYLFVACCALS